MRVAKPWLNAALLILVILAGCSAQEPRLDSFDVKSDPDFRDYERVLSDYARRYRPNAVNTFCVLGFRGGDGSKAAWIIWHEGRQIVLWEPGGPLESSRRKINLKTDVVPAEQDLHGSTYRVTKAWVTNVTDTCVRSGVTVKIPKQAKPTQQGSRR